MKWFGTKPRRVQPETIYIPCLSCHELITLEVVPNHIQIHRGLCPACEYMADNGKFYLDYLYAEMTATIADWCEPWIEYKR